MIYVCCTQVTDFSNNVGALGNVNVEVLIRRPNKIVVEFCEIGDLCILISINILYEIYILVRVADMPKDRVIE